METLIMKLDELSWLIKLAAIITAGGVVTKLVIIPTINYFKKLTSLLNDITTFFPTIEQIAKDFKPNGGNSLRDVIDRIEKKVYGVEERTKIVLELESIGLFETDKQGQYTWVSEKWSEIVMQNNIEASGYGWLAGVNSECRDRITHEWEEALKRSRQFQMKYKVGENGKAKLIECVALPIKSKNNELLGYMGKVAEIKETKLDEFLK